eukprot:4851838-Alexandrium_andersonii.AAC.1
MEPWKSRLLLVITEASISSTTQQLRSARLEPVQLRPAALWQLTTIVCSTAQRRCANIVLPCCESQSETIGASR